MPCTDTHTPQSLTARHTHARAPGTTAAIASTDEEGTHTHQSHTSHPPRTHTSHHAHAHAPGACWHATATTVMATDGLPRAATHTTTDAATHATTAAAHTHAAANEVVGGGVRA